MHGGWLSAILLNLGMTGDGDSSSSGFVVCGVAVIARSTPSVAVVTNRTEGTAVMDNRIDGVAVLDACGD